MSVNVQPSSGTTLYDVTRYVAQNASTCELSGTVLSFDTPQEYWSYAVEIPPNAPPPEGAYLLVPVKMKVTRGAVAVSVLKANSWDYIKEIQVGAAEDWQTIFIDIPGTIPIGSLAFRNVSNAGSSKAMIELLPVEIAETSLPKPRLTLDGASLDRFKPWSGTVPAGYSADWAGIKTRATVEKYSQAQLAIYNSTRFEAPTVELKAEQVIDWLPLADAVANSKETFRMAALGAGWGRWLSAGGFLARQLGKAYFLIGVEADPDHFRWMNEHFIENGFDPAYYRLIEAAVSDVAGTCRFEVGNSQAWYGQSIVKYDDPSKKTHIVRAVTIKDVLSDVPILDYLHMDIQGAEFDVLSSHPDVIDSQVRLINIGTHSAEIEGGLRKLFTRLKWHPIYDVKIGASMLVHVGDSENVIDFEDGAQIWLNPKL